VNTHLDHAGATAKAEGIKLIQKRIDELNTGGLPVVLTGDFNEEQVSAIFNALTLENARKKAPLTDNFATSNGWGSKNQQIDHIFYGNLEVLSYETIRDRWEGYTYISDHNPVMAEFRYH
jgi:endonuclease/exonuclease/phosphatase family metal-dependent hydrolase